MRTKNARSISAAESEHMARVKQLECGVCGAPPPSQAHHIEQGKHFLVVPCCPDCHTGSLGWHGTKALWRVRKLDELAVLNNTIRALYA